MSKDDLESKLVAAGVPEVEVRNAVSSKARGDIGPLSRLLLLKALWDEAINEDAIAREAKDSWLATYLDHRLPFIDEPALQRLLVAKVNTADLGAFVRSVQVLTLYNVANILDDSYQSVRRLVGEDIAQGIGWSVIAHNPEQAEPEASLGGLHALFEEVDPVQRGGFPLRAEEAVFQTLPDKQQRGIRMLLEKQQYSKAALHWRRATGKPVKQCLAEVKRLRETWRDRH